MRARVARPCAGVIALALASLAAGAAVGAGAAAAPPTQTVPDDTAGETHLPAGRFGTVTVYIPDGVPQSVAIFLSGDGGWHLGVLKMAKALSDEGAIVIGVDVTRYLASLRKQAAANASCQLIAGDFENLSHRVQKEIGMNEYHVPVLIGYSSGATVAYAALVQSPPGTFAGALSLGFCPDQDFGGAQLCTGAGLHYTHGKKHDLIFEPSRTLKQPWIALQGQQDQVCSADAVDVFGARTQDGQVIRLSKVGHGFGVERNWLPQFLDAYAGIVDRSNAARAARPQQISDLPVNVVPAQGDSDTFALLMTGDGGWAGLDQELAARLAANGIPTVGLNSLKYFWTERTPEQTATDVARVIRHYLATWNKKRVLLVGYSFGADVLPFVVNRLPPDLKSRIATVSLLGFDGNASFEVSIADWVGSDNGPATPPEVAKISGPPVLCIYGAGEKDTICPSLASAKVTTEQVGKGHHFSGEYAQLADRILAFARNRKTVT